MAGWNDRSRGASPQPPGRAAYSREWRSGLAPRRRRTPKRVLIGAFGLLLAAVVGLVAYFLLLPVAGSVPPARLVLVGIGSYQDRAFPPNAFARGDVAALHALQEINPDQFPEETPWDDMLTGRTLLDQMGHKLQQMEQENLIVFCSLHALVRPGDPGQAELYAIHADPDSPHSEQTDQMIPLPDLLAALGRTSAERIVLLLDVSRLLPNWRLGLLAGDVPAQLEQDVARAGIPRLTVLCSAGPHERSWGAPEWKQSVFGYYTVEGLKGAADGWSERGSRGGTRDQRVSMNELYGYVRENVAAWAREHRGVPQTVLRFGSPEDFPLAALRDRKPASEGGESVAKAEPAGADAKQSAPAEKAEKGEKGNAGEQSVAKGKAKGNADGEKPADPRDELFKLWTQRDLLWREGRTAGSAPHLWRQLQVHLLAAEQQLRAGADEEARATMAQAAGMLQELRRGDVPADLRGDSGRFALTAGSLLGAGRLDRETEQKIAQYAQTIIAAGQNPQPPAATTPPGGSAAAPVSPASPQEPPAPELVARWLMAEASKNARPERLIQLGFVLKTIEQEQWPVELASLARLVARAQSKPSFWSDGLVSQFFGLRMRSTSDGILDPVVFPLVREELRESLRALDAAERWLVADGGANGQAEQWLRKAENSFSRADQIAEQAAAHVRLRDELLVALPDLARWVALRADDAPDRTVEWDAVREAVRRLRRRAELGGEIDAAFVQDVLGMWPATSGEQDQRERLLLQLMLRTHLLQSAPAQATEQASADETLARLSEAASEVDRLRQLLRQDMAAEMNAVIRRGQITAEDWRTADRLLLGPWIEAEQRRQLLEVISGEPRGGFFKPAANRRDERGLWQGFWAIQTLALGGADDDQLARLWEQWDDLLAAVTAPGEGDRLAVRQQRAQLGLLINRQWWMLAERASRPTQGDRKWDLLVRGLDPWDQPSSDPDNTLREQRLAQFQQYLALHLEDAQRRQDQHAAYARRIEQGQRLLAQIAPASPPTVATGGRPRFARIEAPPFRSDRTAELSVAVQAPPADAASLQLLLEGDRVRVSRDGAPVEPGRPVALSSTESAFDLRLDASAVGPQRMLVALLGPDGFPFDVRTDLVLQPPFDPNSWRIEFQTAEEGRPVRQDRFAGRSKLYLPPSGAVSLKAILVRPSTDTTQAVDVAVSRRGANGAVEALIPKTTLQLTPDKTQAELALSLGSPAANPPANGAPAGSTAEPPKAEPVDISEGLVFELTPQGRETFTYLVQPVFWSAEAFVELPRPTFEGDTLSVPVMRSEPQSRENEDLLLPEQIAVSLSIPDSLLQASQTRILGSAEPSLGFGQRRELSVTFDRRRLAEYEEIKLSVAGLPHAFRWRVRPDEPAVLLPGRPPQVRVASPVQGQVLKQEKDPLVIRLEVDASELDLTGGENETWRLSYEILRDEDGRRANAGRSDSWELRSSLARRIGLAGPQEGVWKITTGAGDHERQLSTAGLSGRFVLLARLYRGENVAAEHQVGFAIDDEAPPLVRIDAGDERIFRRDRSLVVRVTAEDRQSGITSIAVGVDANRNEKIDDEERAFAKPFPPIERPAFDDRVTILPRLLPGMAGAYDVLAVATNGVGTSQTSKQRVVLEDPPKPPTKPQPTTGSILVKLSNPRGKKTVTLTGPTRRTETAESGQATVRFSDLQPGAYEIDVRGYMRDGNAKGVQVRAGETTEVEVTVR